MQRIDLDYWYTLGRAMSVLEDSFGGNPCQIEGRAWSRIATAIGWLKPVAEGQFALIPGTQRIAKELIELLSPIEWSPNVGTVSVDIETQAAIFLQISAFHNVTRAGAQDIYVFLIPGRGAYSAKALLEDAASHLSDVARGSLSAEELRDFQLAGACYACVFPTASGFHAMRAVEATARWYHKAVTGITQEVDWTLNPLINGHQGKNQFGLRDQWKKEGARDDSPLYLIIALLSSITQLYRNPIMHPEMVLTMPQAKHVFDTAALVISAMSADGLTREEKDKAAQKEEVKP